MKRQTPEGLVKAAARVVAAWDAAIRAKPSATVNTGMGPAISELRLALPPAAKTDGGAT